VKSSITRRMFTCTHTKHTAGRSLPHMKQVGGLPVITCHKHKGLRSLRIHHITATNGPLALCWQQVYWSSQSAVNVGSSHIHEHILQTPW
jgi:hypothetical protein